ncbi:MAG: imidazole glycerol phosphate synthase subunit HisH [Candidatus Firestonebacteria bacterium]|nr:imidazole glycerol phosphate synthase subunit HisH [Candidatus Firestonebacteria bacterium]
MIAVIDYGVGNLRSVHKAFEKCGFSAQITNNKDIINKSNALVLPGVGAFPQAMNTLKQTGLDKIIHENIKNGKPFLGICLGMQLLFSESEEFGHEKGLNIISGKVKKFQVKLKIPHMGWNQLEINQNCPLLKKVTPGAYMYFVHSFYAKPDNPGDIAAETEYGIKFTAMVWNKNVFACQFHPEKSQDEGLKIIRAFGEMAIGSRL